MDYRAWSTHRARKAKGRDYIRIFGFIVMRHERIEPLWKSARSLLIGLTACQSSLCMYQIWERRFDRFAMLCFLRNPGRVTPNN